jgi:hypothetical protein
MKKYTANEVVEMAIRNARSITKRQLAIAWIESEARELHEEAKPLRKAAEAIDVLLVTVAFLATFSVEDLAEARDRWVEKQQQRDRPLQPFDALVTHIVNHADEHQDDYMQMLNAAHTRRFEASEGGGHD